MNFHCETCDRGVPIEKFRVEGNALIVSCPACGAEGRVDAPSRPRPFAVIAGEGRPSAEESLVTPPGHCPKCVTAREAEALTCARCGLVFVNANESDLAPPPELKARWRGLVERWSDPGEHERLLRYAAGLGQLAPLARLYRIWSVRLPKDEAASRALDSILALVATVSLVPSERSEKKRSRGIALVLGALLVVAVVGLIELWLKYGRAR